VRGNKPVNIEAWDGSVQLAVANTEVRDAPSCASCATVGVAPAVAP
jgi:hypothetical protein